MLPIHSKSIYREAVSIAFTGSGAEADKSYLVEIVGQENDTADDALARGGLELNLDLAVEEVAVRDDGRAISCVFDGEDGTLVGVLDLGAGLGTEGGTSALCEVALDGSAKSRVVGAGCEESWSECMSAGDGGQEAAMGRRDSQPLRGSHLVEVWAETRLEAASATAAAENLASMTLEEQSLDGGEERTINGAEATWRRGRRGSEIGGPLLERGTREE